MTDHTLKDIDIAFKALEERDELFNKIKAEIKEKSYMSFGDYVVVVDLNDVLQIIDKYKAK